MANDKDRQQAADLLAYLDEVEEQEKRQEIENNTPPLPLGIKAGKFVKDAVPPLPGFTAPLTPNFGKPFMPLEAAGKIVKDNPEGAKEGIKKMAPIVGGIGASIATGGLPLIPAAAGVGAVTAGAQALSEGYVPGLDSLNTIGKKALSNPKKAAPVAGRITKAGIVGAGTEFGGRVLLHGAEDVARDIQQSPMATDMARRAIGFQKSQIYNSKSARETERKIRLANRAGRTMAFDRKEGLSFNGEKNFQKALKLKDTSGKEMEDVADIIDKAKGAMIDVNEAHFRTVVGAKKARTGGMAIHDTESAALDKIYKDLNDYTNVNGKSQRLTLDQARELKSRWGNIGYNDKTVTSDASKVYRRASDTMEELISEEIKRFDPKLHQRYIQARKLNASAQTASKGLSNKVAGETGNQPVSSFGLQGQLAKFVNKNYGTYGAKAIRALKEFTEFLGKAKSRKI